MVQKYVFKIICFALFILVTPAQAYEFSDGYQGREPFIGQVRKMFKDNKFAELDAMAVEIRNTKSRYPDGGWKLLAFYQGFDPTDDSPQVEFTNYIEQANKWRQERPKSVTAQVVLGKAWYNYAWHERGNGYDNEVKKEAWPIIYERLDKAWKIVSEPLPEGFADCPERHNLLLVLANAKGIERNEFEVLFQEAVRLEPKFYGFYFNKAEYLQERWHGKEGEWQKFIDDAATNNTAGEGATIYTRTAWSKFGLWKSFNGEGISWDKMKTGFVQITQNFPDSPFILNGFAKFACLDEDNKTIIDLFNKIDPDKYLPEVWGGVEVETCRKKAGLPTYSELSRPKLVKIMQSFNEMAFQNILQLAEEGNRKIIDDLAKMYLKGIGTPVNPVAAYAWLAQDEAMYKERMEYIAKNLTPEQMKQSRQLAEEIRMKKSKQVK